MLVTFQQATCLAMRLSSGCLMGIRNKIIVGECGALFAAEPESWVFQKSYKPHVASRSNVLCECEDKVQLYVSV